MSAIEPDEDEPPPIDLSYDPKTIGKRPAGASSTTKFIYEALVSAGDEGRTVDELVDELEHLIGTMEYRAFERHLRIRRERRQGEGGEEVASVGQAATDATSQGRGRGWRHLVPTDADGNFTSAFMRRGRQWAIRKRLHDMAQCERPTAVLGDDGRWRAGERAPNVLKLWEVRPEQERTIVAPHDPARTEAWNARMAAARGALERAEKALAARTLARKDASIRELAALVRELVPRMRP